MNKYVSVDDVINLIIGEPTEAHYPSWYVDKIKNMETSDNCAMWIDEGDPGTFTCSRCHYKVNRWNNTSFCPDCGARMVGDT